MRLRNVPGADEALKLHEKVIQEGKECRGRWSKCFGNDAPVYIEIGMGKGQFLMTLAHQNPDKNYIGIERYASVLFRALERYDKEEQELENIRFICMDATEIEEVFTQGEVAGIYLNFSDPWPKKRHARRRLTSREFFARYEKVLAEEGVIEFKTDNQDLFEFSLHEVKKSNFTLQKYTWNLHCSNEMNEGNVMTEYEEKFSSLGNPICKLVVDRNGPKNLA